MYLDLWYPAHLALHSAVQQGGRKSSLPLENSITGLPFPSKTPEFHVMNDAYSVSKEIIWEKKNPQGLNFKCTLLRQHGGESALSRLTRHSLLNTHRHKKRNTTVWNFPFHPARVKPADCTHDCQSTVSSFSHHQAPCTECSARFWRNLNCPCLFFPFGSPSRIIGSYWVKKSTANYLMCKFVLKEVEGEKSTEVRVFIAPATLYGVLLLNVKRLVKFIYCLNLEVENAFIHPKRSLWRQNAIHFFFCHWCLEWKLIKTIKTMRLVRISSFPVPMLKLWSAWSNFLTFGQRGKS